MTTYHVKLPAGYIAPLTLASHEGMARIRPALTPRIEGAEVFSRIAALTVARETGGTPVMLTATGKVREVHP